MKTTTVVNTAIFALCLSQPALARKKKKSPGGGSSSSQAGNNIETSYKFSKSSFGAGTTLNLGVQAQNNGGNSKAGAGGSGNTRRDLEEELKLYIRDIEDEIELVARAKGIAGGGDAKGGDSKSRAGNRSKSRQKIKNVSVTGGGSFSANTFNKIEGGNSQSGAGGINFGNGGKGGQMSFGGFGKRSTKVPFARGTFEFSTSSTTNGGNSRITHAFSNSEDGAPGMNVHFRRQGIASGGNAKGGGSKARGGNRNKSSQRIKNVNVHDGGSFNANNFNKVEGGNAWSGPGGANYGNGGAGGSFSVPVGFKRDVEDALFEELLARDLLGDVDDELLARDADVLDLDGEELELFVRETDPELFAYEADEEYLY